jgi:hypothetical protein
MERLKDEVTRRFFRRRVEQRRARVLTLLHWPARQGQLQSSRGQSNTLSDCVRGYEALTSFERRVGRPGNFGVRHLQKQPLRKPLVVLMRVLPGLAPATLVANSSPGVVMFSRPLNELEPVFVRWFCTNQL